MKAELTYTLSLDDYKLFKEYETSILNRNKLFFSSFSYILYGFIAAFLTFSFLIIFKFDNETLFGIPFFSFFTIGIVSKWIIQAIHHSLAGKAYNSDVFRDVIPFYLVGDLTIFFYDDVIGVKRGNDYSFFVYTDIYSIVSSGQFLLLVFKDKKFLFIKISAFDSLQEYFEIRKMIKQKGRPKNTAPNTNFLLRGAVRASSASFERRITVGFSLKLRHIRPAKRTLALRPPEPQKVETVRRNSKIRMYNVFLLSSN